MNGTINTQDEDKETINQLRKMLDANDAEIKVLRDLVAKEEVCVWEWDVDRYNTNCGNVLYYADGSPMKFCPYCGKRMVELKYDKQK